jgi:hypothetical protein
VTQKARNRILGCSHWAGHAAIKPGFLVARLLGMTEGEPSQVLR